MLEAALAAALALAAPAGAAEPKPQAIRVMPGDTLWSIAQKYLKDPKRWNVVLRYNKLPTSDPTVALPGMVLMIPPEELKEQYQAATLELVKSNVSYRRVDTPSWDKASKDMELFEDWALRTQDQSWARVRFLNDGVLALDPNSMAILKSPKNAKNDHELELKHGTAHATVARVVTPSARIVPKGRDTEYSARILEDLSTRVQVYKGAADVSDLKGKQTLEVKAGFSTQVSLGRVPAAPTRIPAADLAAPQVADFGKGPGSSAVKIQGGAPGVRVGGGVGADLAALSVGVPVASYHIRIKRGTDCRDRSDAVFDKVFDPDATINLKQAGLRPGNYFSCVSVIDLLGEETWGKAKPFKPEEAEEIQSLAFAGSFEVTRPEEAEVKVKAARYRIVGRADKDLSVLINGDRVAKDTDGLFSTEVLLKPGPNNFRIEASDVRGNDKVLIRKIVFEP